MPYNISQALLSRQTAAVSPESNPDEYLTVLNYSGSLKNTADTIFKAPWVTVKGWCLDTEVCFLKPIISLSLTVWTILCWYTSRHKIYNNFITMCSSHFHSKVLQFSTSPWWGSMTELNVNDRGSCDCVSSVFPSVLYFRTPNSDGTL